jgi:hypothetical protein
MVLVLISKRLRPALYLCFWGAQSPGTGVNPV